MENLFGFIFWHNPYEKIWYAIHRDTQLDFFNGNRQKSIFYKSTKISTLVEILSKEEVLNELTKKDE